MATQFEFERYVAGDVTAEERLALEALVAESPEAAATVDALRASNATILAALPPKDFAEEVQRRARRDATKVSPSPRRPLVLGGLGMAACAAVAAFFLVTPPPDDVRAKGDSFRLLVTSSRPAEVARAGDRLQVRVAPGEFAFVHVVSLDGNGHVTRHFPAGASRGEVEPLQVFALPTSIELDSAPDFERFFLIGSPVPISPAAVMAALARLPRGDAGRTAPLVGAKEWRVVDKVIRKERAGIR